MNLWKRARPAVSMLHSLWRRRFVVMVALAAPLAALEATAATDTTRVLYVCVASKNGAMRVVGPKIRCDPKETRFNWTASVVPVGIQPPAAPEFGRIDGQLVSGCSPIQPGDPSLDGLSGYTVHIAGHAYLLETSNNGEFHFDAVIPGTYELRADKIGRASLALGRVIVGAGKTTRLATTVIPCSVSCGDSQIGPNEQCDDGNTTSNDGCSSTCQLEDLCGNGHLDLSEACDGADLGGKTCETLGFGPGTLTCDQCQLNVVQCGTNDDNPCTDDVIVNGVPSHPAKPQGTVVGNCQICDGVGNVTADPSCGVSH